MQGVCKPSVVMTSYVNYKVEALGLVFVWIEQRVGKISRQWLQISVSATQV